MTTLYALLCRVLLLLSFACVALAVCLLIWRAPGLAIILGVVLAWRKIRRRDGGGWAFGTARMLTTDELYDGGLIGARHGLILGRAGTSAPSRVAAIRHLLTARPSDSATACRRFFAAFFGARFARGGLIRLSRFVHLSTFAPTGRGKGVGLLIPNLLHYRGSCVVTDPKGELASLTGAHRRERFGHRVVRLDPFGVCGPGSDTFNPLDMIDRDAPDLIDQARELANALVIRSAEESEPHWNDNAEIVLTAMIAFVAALEPRPELRNLQLVRQLLASRERYSQCIQVMQKSNACGGMLARLGHLLTWHVDRELGSILSTVHRHTAFLDSTHVAENTTRSSFDPRMLRSASRPTTVYLILPENRLVTQAALMRLWVGGLIRAVASGGANERNPVLFLLDEAGNIGHIQVLEDAVTLMRGYGVRLWFFFQSMGQLTQSFGAKASVFMDNIDTRIFFGVNAFETAESISKSIGACTITNFSSQKGSSSSQPVGGSVGQNLGQTSDNSGWSSSEAGRALFLPEEVMRMPEDTAFIFHRNWPPILASLVRYFDAPEFRRGKTGSSRGLGFESLFPTLFSLAFGILAVVSAAAIPVPMPMQRLTPAPGYPPHRNSHGSPAYRFPSEAQPRREESVLDWRAWISKARSYFPGSETVVPTMDSPSHNPRRKEQPSWGPQPMKAKSSGRRHSANASSSSSTTTARRREA